MPSQIETRIGKLENAMGAGAARVVVIFEDDNEPAIEGATIIKVRFVEGGRDATTQS